MVAKAEQIRSLLSGKACDLVESAIPSSECSTDSYRVVFTVNRREIDEYIAKNGFPEGVVRSRAGTRDGVYMIRSMFGYSVYYQERGIVMDKQFFISRTAAVKRVTDYRIGLSGTGLKFE